MRSPESISRSLKRLSRKNIEFICDEIKELDFENNRVVTTQHVLPYDYLIIALGVDAIGDVTALKLPVMEAYAPKAGIFAHYQGEVVARNIACLAQGLSSKYRYTGKGSCIMHTGFGRARYSTVHYFAALDRDSTEKESFQFLHLYQSSISTKKVKLNPIPLNIAAKHRYVIIKTGGILHNERF
ncbi:MAG: hypothetical protein GX892_14890 [Thermoanaerobacteraceae bacterium]|nr:hypothetical protein [Thermoanaerobacteraceae bacterium]